MQEALQKKNLIEVESLLLEIKKKIPRNEIPEEDIQQLQKLQQIIDSKKRREEEKAKESESGI